jgi:hypothetical protein
MPSFVEFDNFDQKIDPASCYFYHTSDLPGYGHFQGQWDIRGYEDGYLSHYNFGGKRVFDCGVASGFLAFEMERRGANVTGLDRDETQDEIMGLIPYDDFEERFGAPLKASADHMRLSQQSLRASFLVARQAHKSNVGLMIGNIMSHNIPIASADVALFGNILLHLRDPLSALYNVASKVTDAIIVTEVLDIPPISLDAPPRLLFRPNYKDRTNPNPVTWWFIEPSWLKAVLEIVGFRRFDVIEIKFKREPSGEEVAGYSFIARRTSPL